MSVTTPVAFKKICRNLGPDVREFVSSEDEFVAHALIGVDREEAILLIPFLRQKLKNESPAELSNWMWSMPGSVSFVDEQELVRFLRALLSRLQEVAL